jgi:DNA-binding XRE family transcriptional regulator
MSTKKSAKSLLENIIGPATFGSFLSAARTAMGVTQEKMGRILDVSKSVICDIEKGRQMVSPKLAHKIAKKAGLSTKLAVQLCLQDQLRLSNIDMKVELKAA